LSTAERPPSPAPWPRRQPGKSDSKTYGTIGAIFGIMTWFIAIGAVIILGAVAGAVWDDRRNQQVPGTMTRP
jgi:uncharacterized BrkB/YihY/UPF0761 family membrane protein